MRRLGVVLAVGIVATAAHSEPLSGAFQHAQQILKDNIQTAADAQTTRQRSEFTENKIPVREGECSAPRYYKDAIERQRVAMDFEVTYCKEKITFEERQDGTEGRGIFRRPRWVRVPGTEKTSYEYETTKEDFDLSYDPDSFRTREIILRDLKEACESTHEWFRIRRLADRARNERNNVRCP